MAGNASILIQEQNSGKRTNFLVFELDGCGQKTGKSRLVSCPVVVRKKDDFVYIIPFDDNMKVISEQYDELFERAYHMVCLEKIPEGWYGDEKFDMK